MTEGIPRLRPPFVLSSADAPDLAARRLRSDLAPFYWPLYADFRRLAARFATLAALPIVRMRFDRRDAPRCPDGPASLGATARDGTPSATGGEDWSFARTAISLRHGVAVTRYDIIYSCSSTCIDYPSVERMVSIPMLPTPGW
jgi:hypothetical protein